VVLHRWVRVVRVEIKGLEPGFGIACEFEDGIETMPQGQAANGKEKVGAAGSAGSARH